MNLFRIARIIFIAFFSSNAFAELPHISNVTINPTPPGAKVTAAYLNLRNAGNETLTLLEVSSPVIGRVEIHQSEIVDDVARMRKQDSVEVAPDETVAFTHGGLHIMLMDLAAPMLPGDEIPLIFHTSEGDITIDVRVSETIQLPKDSDHNDSSHNH